MRVNYFNAYHQLSTFSYGLCIYNRNRKGGGAVLRVVYIDVLFGINLIINYLVLFAAAKLNGAVIRRFFIALAAAAGALYCCIVYFMDMQFMLAFAVKVIAGAGMVIIAFGANKSFLRMFLSFCGVSFAFGGCVLAIYYLTGGAGGMISMKNGVYYLRVSFATLLISALICYMLINLVFKRCTAKGSGRDICRICIKDRQKSISFRALVDTGNHLTDPLTNRPVVIAEYNVIRELLTADITDVLDSVTASDFPFAIDRLPGEYKFRLLPYKTIGCELDMLLAFQPERIIIDDKDIGGGLVAISPNRISDGGAYNAVAGVAA